MYRQTPVDSKFFSFESEKYSLKQHECLDLIKKIDVFHI
jgi:hypothetical protein